MNYLTIRAIYPAVIDTGAFSCFSRYWKLTPSSYSGLLSQSRALCTGSPAHDSSQASARTLDSKNNEITPRFTNRNPRSLELMGIARKRKGWKFQYPPKQFYHKLMFEQTARQIRAWVEHSSGKVVVSSSTQEFAIAKHLYSLTDVSAAKNIGRVLAQRCLESGITCMIEQAPINSETSPKYASFLDAVKEGGVDLSEPEEVQPDYEPGIDYEDEFEYNDLQRRQKLATQKSEVRWGNKNSFRM